MLKTIWGIKDFSEYQEKIAKFFVDSMEERLGIFFNKEIISLDIERVLISKKSFLIIHPDNDQEIKGMILAYPANFNSFVSFVPESSISMYIDPINVDQNIWSAFMEEMRDRRFSNIMYLKRDKSLTESIFKEKGFKELKKMTIPEAISLKVPKNSDGVKVCLMKKTMTPKKRE